MTRRGLCTVEGLARFLGYSAEDLQNPAKRQELELIAATNRGYFHACRKPDNQLCVSAG